MPKSILVVDDSKIVLDISEFVLKSVGYRVSTAVGGNEALEILGHKKVDLVLVDINMPGMDGYTLTSAIRSDDRLKDIPIIIVTTEAEARDKQKGFDAGADAYIVKPIVPEELLGHVELLIGKAE
ncbi:MAG: response regulator [Deltaproteobacteria bacterium]|nr:MAG: response regulator [Deltaproteobacteria bacterium]